MAEDSFDFVIVGAGSAGCVLAERLSRDGRHSVAVLEAGGMDRSFYIHMPLGYGKTFYDPSLNWGYVAEPDPGLAGRADYWPRGRVVGGSSAINAMVWIRGNRRDYDDWAAEGNPGWRFEDCLPAFRAIEHNGAGADAWRGTGGAMHVADVAARAHPLVARFLAAGREAGLAQNPDFNGAEQDGIGVYQITTRGGRRHSAASAFLYPALRRRNLTLFTEALACRLTVAGRRVTGVTYWQYGRHCRIAARCAVILAAGAINSPQLLQLSGIGDAPALTALGIAPVLHAPAVGRHMQDHLGINYSYRTTERSLNEVLRPWWGKLAAGADYLLRGRGPLSLSLNQGGGFVRTRPELDRPNLQLYFQAVTTVSARAGTRPLTTPDPFPGFSIGMSNCQVESRGSVTISRDDPFAPPRIRANALGTEGDVRNVIEGLAFLRRLAAQPALAGIIAEEVAPGPAVADAAAMLADFRARAGTVYHPCGTCRMGPDPATAVVDARLRAHGLAGLRIADASVFPALIVGNTNAPVMMVAARAAEMMLEDAREA